MTDINQINQLVQKILPRVGKTISQAFSKHNFIVNYKSDKTLITKIDKEVENYIIKQIKQQFPNHHIFGEETGGDIDLKETTWVIDPIDGTTNFASGISIFGTMITIIKTNQVIASFIYDPLTNEFIQANREKGLYLNLTKLQQKTTPDNLNQYTLIIESGKKPNKRQLVNQYLNNYESRFRSFRKYGSVVAQAKYITRLQPIISIILGAKLYDIAPVSLFFEEIGYETYDLKGNKWQPTNFVSDFIASPTHLKKEILEMFNSL